MADLTNSESRHTAWYETGVGQPVNDETQTDDNERESA